MANCCNLWSEALQSAFLQQNCSLCEEKKKKKLAYIPLPEQSIH